MERKEQDGFCVYNHLGGKHRRKKKKKIQNVFISVFHIEFNKSQSWEKNAGIYVTIFLIELSHFYNPLHCRSSFNNNNNNANTGIIAIYKPSWISKQKYEKQISNSNMI